MAAPVSANSSRGTRSPQLCLDCHDGGETIDVYGDVQQGGQPARRSAGSFNGLDRELFVSPMASDLGHNLERDTDIPTGGDGATMKLTCGSCHDPHGNSYYRNIVEIDPTSASPMRKAPSIPQKMSTRPNRTAPTRSRTPTTPRTSHIISPQAPTQRIWRLSAWNVMRASILRARAPVGG